MPWASRKPSILEAEELFDWYVIMINKSAANHLSIVKKKWTRKRVLYILLENLTEAG